MGMPDPLSNVLRVAILSRSVRERDCLMDILETNGLQVVDDETMKKSLSEGIDQEVADLILVNLDDSDDSELDILIEKIKIPILFNDSASIRKQVTAGGRAWGRRLAEKIVKTAGDEFSLADSAARNEAGSVEVSGEDSETADVLKIDYDALEADGIEAEQQQSAENTGEPVIPYKDMPTAEIVALNKEGKLEITPNRARRIWVLGASIGGPQAVKAFLAKLPEDLPVCFILAQHIGVGFVNLLAEQLGRVTRLRVSTPEDGMILEKGQLVVAPVEKRINFSGRGIISMESIKQKSIYSPSIDDVLTVVAKHYGADANAIIFSGMGNDGTVGCHLIAQKGGMIWAQESESCIISSMADSVRSAGIVSLSATPERLAESLVEYLEGEFS